MCMAKFATKKNKVGGAVTAALTQAKAERRLICGLLPAIAYLEKDPDAVLFCVLPETAEDAATHMQSVLLQAYCYENYIPVIKVDSGQKLAELCGDNSTRKGHWEVCRCAVVTRNGDGQLISEDMSVSEKQLTDFYKRTADDFPQPIVRLPV